MGDLGVREESCYERAGGEAGETRSTLGGKGLHQSLCLGATWAAACLAGEMTMKEKLPR